MQREKHYSLSVDKLFTKKRKLREDVNFQLKVCPVE